ncbi:MAG: hypothetical protein EAZ15_06365 [Sphingobacteriales bacterium]|nr:MAG: hypothetical protein EAZ15_06365 [Sphingobacteriales bacterium]
MLKKIISTYQANLIIAALSFFTVWLTAKYLGTVGRGEISLFLLNLSVVQIVSSVVGRGAMVYLYNRHSISNILVLTVIWAILTSIFVSSVLFLFNMIESNMLLNTIILSLLSALFFNNYGILLGANRFFAYNFIRVIQTALTMLVFLLLFYVYNLASFGHYIIAMYISFSIAVFISFYAIFRKEKLTKPENLKTTLFDFFKLGGLNQLSTIIQLGNYRATMYMLSKYVSLGASGVFSLALTLTEAAWMLKDSIVTSHHSHVSSHHNHLEAAKNNTKFMLLSGLGTFLIMVVALVIPLSIYIKIFGKDFEAVKQILFLLSPGIVALAVGSVISHYFSGTGKLKYCTLTSFAGLIVVLVFGFVLIPKYGVNGAALANTLSYSTTSALLLVIYFSGRLKREKLPNL